MSVLFAATYPERTRASLVYGSGPRFTRAPGFPFGPHTRGVPSRRTTTGTNGSGAPSSSRASSLGADASDRRGRDQFASRMRQSASPGAVRQLDRMNLEIDVRGVLPSIRVPTLVLHRTEDHVPVDGARGWRSGSRARVSSSFPGGPHMSCVRRLESASSTRSSGFLVPICTGAGRDSGARERACHRPVHGHRRLDREGGRARRPRLARAARAAPCAHPAAARALPRLARSTRPVTASSRGSTDRRARSAARARSREAVHELGIDVRAGLHTGECELVDDKVAGIAVNIGARVAAEARPGRGARLPDGEGPRRGLGSRFEDRGAAELKGVPGEWRLYAVAGSR